MSSMSVNLTQSFQTIYDVLRKDPEAEFRRNQLVEGKVSKENFRPEHYSNGIGSLDATSCLGCIFTANNGQHVVSFHYDGRDLHNLFPLFQTYKGEVVRLEITGGVQKRNQQGELGSDYQLVEQEHTQANFEKLISFSRRLPCIVDLKSWTIGEDSSKESLVCEYLAQPGGRVTLLETGSIYHKCPPPEFIPRYTSNSLNQEAGISIVYDSTQSRKLNLAGSPFFVSSLNRAARNIQLMRSDSMLLANFSTTPELEPPYFCDTIRKVAHFILSKDHVIQSDLLLPEDAPCIILQGEAGRIGKV